MDELRKLSNETDESLEHFLELTQPEERINMKGASSIALAQLNMNSPYLIHGTHLKKRQRLWEAYYRGSSL